MSSDRQWRILIVDDNLEMLNAIFEALQREFETIGAINGLDALEKLDRYEPDLIILDIMMPGLNGVDTCRAIRRNVRFTDVPVLFLSGQDESIYSEDARDLGVTRFLRKPISPDRLVQVCQSLIRQYKTGSPPPKQYAIADLNTATTTGGSQPPPKPQTGGAQDSGRSLETDSDESISSMATILDSPSEAEIENAAPDYFGQGRPRIMIVDDDRDEVACMLATLGSSYEILGVTDPLTAISNIIRFQPDLLILDAAMPRISGFQLSQLLRLNRNLRTIQVIFNLPNGNPGQIDYAQKLGAAEVVIKPFEPEALLRKVNALVDAPEFIVREKALSFDQIRQSEITDPSKAIML